MPEPEQVFQSSDQQPTHRVFVSYTHDSEDHKERVLTLSDRLINDGVDCHLDRYYETPPPAEGWPEWMLRQIECADFVIIVSTETYNRRFRRQEEQGNGLGAQWEGAVITQSLYNNATYNTRFILIGFEPFQQARVYTPVVLQSTNYYDVSDEGGYERLYRHLTGQPEVQKAPLGQKRGLPVRGNATWQSGNAGRSSNTHESTASSLSASTSPRAPATDLTPAELRRLMTERLSRGEVAVLWYDLFGTTLDDDLPGRPLPECVIELLARSLRRREMEGLVASLAQSYPYVFVDPT